MHNNQNPKKNNKFLIIIIVAIIIVAVVCFFSTKNKNSTMTSLPNTKDNSLISDKDRKKGNLILSTIDSVPNPNSLEINTTNAEEFALKSVIAAQNYYDEFGGQTEVVSWNGFFYECPSESFLDLSLLKETDHFPIDENGSVFFMLLKPEDVEKIANIVVSETDNILKIFALVKTDEGFFMTSAYSEGGHISTEKLTELLSLYDTDNGSVLRFFENSKEYKNICESIKQFTNSDKNLDVRYMAGDEDYAFAVVSPENQNSSIKAYVLKKDNDNFNVEISGFEGDYQYRTTINKKFPDMSIKIMPTYTLYYHLRFLKYDFDNVITAMLESENIPKNFGEPNYVSGTNEFVYVTFKNGNKYLGKGNIDSSFWSFIPITDYETAEVYMIENSDDPPLFIVKQEN